ncbi:MAG TPA: DUF4386 domain-containing protein [Chloroflexota bacterium]|nr:DUF4386 domain-containing protein [Chloroflexota bacterium]
MTDSATPPQTDAASATTSDRRVRRLTAALLIAVPVLFNVCFLLLQTTFGYPEILRQPADEILQRFAAGGPALVALWYAFALTPVLFLPAAVLLRRTLAQDAPASVWLELATPLAVAACLVQTLGLLRWTFLVPALARTYLDPATDAAARAATVAVFQAFHQYAGVAAGEHLGYLFTAAWTAAISLAMRGSPVFRRWISWLGLVAAGGILAGLLEPAGLAAAGAVNALGYVVWSLWLIVAGVALLRGRAPAARPARAGRALDPAAVAAGSAG